MQGKLLKGIGLALIAMPEPITTPIGVGLIAASWVLSRQQEKKKKAHLRNILGEYLNTYRPFGYGMNYVPKTSSNLPYRAPLPLYSNTSTTTKNDVIKKPIINYQPVRFASFKDEMRPINEQPKFIVHTLDRRVIAKRYVETGGTKAGFVGYWGRQTKLEINKPIHHTLRLTPASLS
jgi:hypothetical protein